MPKGFRRQRAVALIQREIIDIIETEVSDESVADAQVSRLELAADNSVAHIYLLPGESLDEEQRKQLLKAYRRAAGFVRTQLAHRLRLRRTPEIDFRIDSGRLHADRIDTLLERIKKRSKTGGPAATILLLLLSGWAWPGQAGEIERYEAAATIMGSSFRVAAYGENRGALASAVRGAFDEARRIDGMLSNYQPDSELSRVNREAAGGPVEVSQELADLLAACLDYSRKTDGAFDITVGALVETWGFFKGSGSLPSRWAISSSLTKVGYEKLELDPAKRRVRFKVRGLSLDPGGIGKGYAVERMAALLRRYGVTSAMISAGTSSMAAIGAPPTEPRGWRVTIEDPQAPGKIAAELFLNDDAFSTSGSQEKFFEVDGKTYSHIIDPRSGMPAQGVAQVSLRRDSALEAEAWTTALFVNGPEWVRSNAPRGFEVYLCEQAGGCSWLTRR